MKKILIANRGEIARRVMRTCRQMGLATVAVYSEPDRRAPFALEADEAVALGGLTSADSYLRIDAILAAARRTGADAIHPGYGFLAENAQFAAACRNEGLTFIGPAPEAIAAMGSKIEAKRRMHKAGVPVLESVEVAPTAGEPAARELTAAAERLGWPVLVKASAGGGGRGMRIVRRADELPAALEAARREAGAAFGDDTVFLEPYVESSRHVEIQIFGDTHGQVVHLFERECSIQRRHQKIIEESPSPVVDDTLRQAMGQAAVRAGQAIGYTNAGTVEFLLTPEGKFYFLEVNTRLQVEHPVTECVTGLDLVRLQILVAQGEPLPPEVTAAAISGHAIEVRLYAEDPASGFLPVTGRLARFRVPEVAGLRVESGVADGDEISPYYDPMIAKLIVHAPTRAEAARRLARALAHTELHGVRTNRELLVRILEHPEFVAGQFDTHFLERHDPAVLGAPLGDAAVEQVHAVAAALAAQAESRATARVLRSLPSGWRNNPSALQRRQFTGASGPIDVGYRFGREGLVVEIDGTLLADVRLESCRSDEVVLEYEGVRRTYGVHRVDGTYYVDSPWGASRLEAVPRFPLADELLEAGSLIAPLPGVVVEVKVAVGAEVAAGDVLLVIESMKMLHPVAAPVAGRVAQLHVEAAGHVEAGTLLAVLEEEPADS